MRNLVTRFANDEQGAALVEYGMLVGLIAVVCIAAVTALGVRVDAIFTRCIDNEYAAGNNRGHRDFALYRRGIRRY